MDLMGDKDEFAGKNINCDNGVRNFDSENTSADWRISGSNSPVSYESPMSICQTSCYPSRMMDPSRQNLWHDGGFNVHTNAMATFRGLDFSSSKLRASLQIQDSQSVL